LIERELAAELDALAAQGLRRSLLPVDARRAASVRAGKRTLVDFASNDYLGLATDPSMASAACAAASKWGSGSAASRLLSGSLSLHSDLEAKLARLKGEEAALVFSSGYLANLGAITALASERDVVLVDRLNHASLIDAARLSRAKFWVYPHLDVAAASRLLDRAASFRRRFVVTDSYFSMDGHVAPLADLAELCAKKKASLVVDEAHATGVFGEKGGGLVEEAGLEGRVDVTIGTLSKALGSVGGFVAGSGVLKEYLVNSCRPFIYTTAPAPAASAAAARAVDIVRAKPALRRKLHANAAALRERLLSSGHDLMGSAGPIVPVRAPGTAAAVAWRDRLFAEGFYVPAIRPPSVPKGTDRLRISVSAAHTPVQIERLAALLAKLKEKK